MEHISWLHILVVKILLKIDNLMNMQDFLEVIQDIFLILLPFMILFTIFILFASIKRKDES